MITIKREIKSPFSNYGFEKTSSQYQVILTYLETNDAEKRRIGYALSIPKFDELPDGLKEIVRQKWFSEQKKENFEKEFCALCDKVFRFQPE
ncbi:MAG: hypothetical protein K9W45_10360 [Candidatus Heimdallarchaeum aukensis]|uniref:Uncharacterized protein n=1 Tax=Candidatus Heimdallarchaeum aukensis TaxID=2876573 RepID=A0A9Y1BJV7_9ARCH|nr:MAG: hypothetical protein K9W45_10360 [Candidatus Heimdallarchaeum aukensis]